MKMYTNSEQTAKLIELGFEKPKTCLGVGTKEEAGDLELGYIWAYSIGELIGMLPKIHPLYHDPYCLDIGFDTVKWIVGYTYNDGYAEVVNSTELIDALYDMILKLKKEEII